MFQSLTHLCLQKNQSSQALEYHGPLRQRVGALVDTLHGGQIVVDSNTFQQVHICLPELGRVVPATPSYSLLQPHRGSLETTRNSMECYSPSSPTIARLALSSSNASCA